MRHDATGQGPATVTHPGRVLRPIAAAVASVAMLTSIAWAQSPVASPSDLAPSARRANVHDGVDTDAARLERRQTPTVRAVQRAAPSVVNIYGEKTIRATAASMAAGGGSMPRSVNGMGTGVIIDPRGYIITNYHVVQDVNDIHVELASGIETTATLVAAKVKSDLALIKLNGVDPQSPLTTIPRGRSDDLMVGEDVIAIGNAFGYVHTTTQGIISALHRDVPVNEDQEYHDLIQISAGINPGNSGGPLLNIYGDIIGINVAVRVGAQQIAFAIPIDQVIDTVTEMIDYQTNNRLSTGIQVAGGPRDGDGVSVTHVAASSPAAREGLRPGDRVVRVGTRPVDDKFDLALAMIDHRTGQPLDFSVVRGGRRYQVAVATQAPVAAHPDQFVWDSIGLRARPLSTAQLDSIRRDMRANFQGGLQGGLSVVAVRPGSVAAKCLIRRGDILIGMHDFATVSIEDIPLILNEPTVRGMANAQFKVIRGSDVLWGEMNIASATTAGPMVR